MLFFVLLNSALVSQAPVRVGANELHRTFVCLDVVVIQVVPRIVLGLLRETRFLVGRGEIGGARSGVLDLDDRLLPRLFRLVERWECRATALVSHGSLGAHATEHRSRTCSHVLR